jgi:thiamine biosynthesis protein ThiS
VKVILNGEERQIETGSTVHGIIAELGLKPERVAVELNGIILKRANWSSTVLVEGDKVEVVHFVGGGAGATSFEAI